MQKEILGLKLLPKVELHVHIEGAVSAETYFRLAEKNIKKLPVNTLDEWKKYFEFKNFPHFIDVYAQAVSTIKTSEDLILIIENFYKQQAIQNIIYSEAFISATTLKRNLTDDEIIDGVKTGSRLGEKEYSVKVNIIPDIARHHPETQTEVLTLVKKGFEEGLFIGLGLGGLETGYPAKIFKETFAEARDCGLKIVAHAGEVVGSESIWGAVKDLNVLRIGHGIRSIEDPELLDYLKECQLPIEVSPTSNYHLGVVDKDKNHPIRKMVDSGLLCTINTDDPAMFSTNIFSEYELLYKQGFSIEELYGLNLNAIKSSFLSKKEKTDLCKIHNDYIQQQKNN